jgi:hypothetical protein
VGAAGDGAFRGRGGDGRVAARVSLRWLLRDACLPTCLAALPGETAGPRKSLPGLGWDTFPLGSEPLPSLYGCCCHLGRTRACGKRSGWLGYRIIIFKLSADRAHVPVEILMRTGFGSPIQYGRVKRTPHHEVQVAVADRVHSKGPDGGVGKRGHTLCMIRSPCSDCRITFCFL